MWSATMYYHNKLVSNNCFYPCKKTNDQDKRPLLLKEYSMWSATMLKLYKSQSFITILHQFFRYDNLVTLLLEQHNAISNCYETLWLFYIKRLQKKKINICFEGLLLQNFACICSISRNWKIFSTIQLHPMVSKIMWTL